MHTHLFCFRHFLRLKHLEQSIYKVHIHLDMECLDQDLEILELLHLTVWHYTLHNTQFCKRLQCCQQKYNVRF